MRARLRCLVVALLAVAICGCGDDGGKGEGDGGSDGGMSVPYEERFDGTCILFELADGREVCLMSTPQDGTPGDLIAEEMPTGSDVGSMSAPLRDDPPDPLPSSVDHRSDYLDGCLRIHNQHVCGWCVAHSTAAAFEALHCSKGCGPVAISEPDIWFVGHERDEFFGCANGWWIQESLRTIAGEGVVSSDVWAYQPSGGAMNAARPSDSELMDNRVHKATAWRSVPERDLDAIKEALASGREVVVSVRVYDIPAWSSGTSTIDVTPGAGLRGYHAITLVGYDDAAQTVTFVNSWGKSWGDGGYGKFSYEYINRYSRGGGYLVDVDTSIPGNACGGAEPDDAGMPRDTCAGLEGCADCLALSGCSWCEDDGGSCVPSDAMGSCSTVRTTVPKCDASSDPCNSASDCEACTARADEGCGWCGDTGTCITWRERGVDCRDLATLERQCVDCGANGDCMSCSEEAGCGWCSTSSDNTCVEGAEAPDSASCSPYVGDGDMCTNPCAEIADCEACHDRDGCGWCDAEDACMPGGYWGPAGGFECMGDWDWFDFACDNTDATGGCGAAASCGECVARTGRNGELCRWCETSGGATASCVESDECMGVEYYRREMCPSPDAGTDGGPMDAGPDAAPMVCPAGASCRSDSDCCDGADDPCCEDRRCEPMDTSGTMACCGRQTDTCSGDGDCCGAMTCVGGTCQCRGEGESCVQTIECCGGYVCNEMGRCG